jgi:UDP-glucose-4-epimerase GalE
MLSDYASAYRIGFVALRYFNAAGASPEGDIGEDHTPETHLIPLVLQVALGKRSHIEIYGTDYPTPDGTCIRDYIHVDDLSDAHILAVEQLEPGQNICLNVGVGQGYSVRQVIASAEQITGRNIPYKEVPRRPGDPPELVASADRIRKLFHWSPKYTELNQIIATAWNWHRKHPEGYRSITSE